MENLVVDLDKAEKFNEFYKDKLSMITIESLANLISVIGEFDMSIGSFGPSVYDSMVLYDRLTNKIANTYFLLASLMENYENGLKIDISEHVQKKLNNIIIQ